ncbi:MFS general substrate transporter [Dacryopinax primogenitus]|uniref:MFS general substrate transporter n=1 Tax=Dacryopinax primogenitus (strain DJM 731) TaxID=1858805 RepID=M5FZQ0_DACPD|nr:MFS general substrate transporter [Dacryopinax primogenitus]EJT96987.1 MFS general substrate transporter [Dacryopinax primogenitus]
MSLPEKTTSKVEADEAFEPVVEDAGSVSDGDDALKLVGTRRQYVFDEEYNRRLTRKLDWVIPPICAAVYFTQFLDKTTLNYASIMGLPITGQNYNNVSMAFYIGFLVWEFPTQYIAQRLPIAKYLGCNVVVWGAIVMLHAVAPYFGPFFALRFILGMLESCVAPILILIISMFYRKNEQASRIACFYLMNGLTSIFGGFVAYGISFYPGSYAPWKIIYLLLGGLAIVVGIVVLLFLPDSPVTARFLTEEERIAALERVRDDQGGTHNKTFKRYQVWEAVLDPRTWCIVLVTMLTSIPNGALSNFSNIIIKSFGYTSQQALILSTPGGLVGAVTTVLCGYFSDRRGDRMMPIVGAVVPTIVGAAILVGASNSGIKGLLLFAIYLVQTFGSALSVIYAWNASNTSGHTKKVTINAVTLVAFAIGNIIGTEIFQPSDAPAYIPGKTAIIVLLCITIVVCVLLRVLNIRLNREKKRELERLMAEHGWGEEEVRRERERNAFADKTDRENPYFVYTL